MKEFLRNPWFYLSDMGNNSFAYMANVRPQLLFYGKSRNNVASYDQGLTREEVLDWIQGNHAGTAESFLTPKISFPRAGGVNF